MLATPKYQTVTGSWAEKRGDMEAGVNGLPAPLRAEARTRLSRLRPALPDLSNMMEVEAGGVIETEQFRMRIDAITGAIVWLENKRTGSQFATDRHPLALFTYQTLSQDDYDRFLASYITVRTDWAPKDFGKPNIGHFGAKSKTWQATTARTWKGAGDHPDRILVQLDLGSERDDAVTAWPRRIFLRLDLPADAPVLKLDLSWFEKRANRMPEALWLTFQPQVGQLERWRLSKLGQTFSPFDVVSGGNRHMHALTGPLSYSDDKRSVSIESLDAPVVSLGHLSPIHFSRDRPDLANGFHYSLFNNAWGTNYIQWFAEDARFRFRLNLA
jgi:hypothetical protein